MLQAFDSDDIDSLDYILMSKPSMLDRLEKYQAMYNSLNDLEKSVDIGNFDNFSQVEIPIFDNTEEPLALPNMFSDLNLLEAFKKYSNGNNRIKNLLKVKHPTNTLATTTKTIDNTAKTIGNLLNRTTQQVPNIDIQKAQNTNNKKNTNIKKVQKQNSKIDKNIKEKMKEDITKDSLSRKKMIKEAKKMLNKPYIWGASPESNKGADCSSLVCKVVKKAKGINLPRTAQAQWKLNVGTYKLKEQTIPGDVVYFNFPNKRGVEVSHTGICLDKGCNTIIDASHGAGKVRIKKLTKYYKDHIVGFKEF